MNINNNIPKLFDNELYKDNKEEFLYLDTLNNRLFLENLDAFVFGGLTALASSLIISNIKIIRNRVLLCSLSCGITAALANNRINGGLYNSYYNKWWKKTVTEKANLNPIPLQFNTILNN